MHDAKLCIDQVPMCEKVDYTSQLSFTLTLSAMNKRLRWVSCLRSQLLPLQPLGIDRLHRTSARDGTGDSHGRT